MTGVTRRGFLTRGAALGVLGRPGRALPADRTGRFVVDVDATTRTALERAGLDLVHDISPVGLLVVRGPESNLRRVTRAYEPDVWIPSGERRLPSAMPAHTEVMATQTNDLYQFQWDKQVQRIPEVHRTTRGAGARVAIVDSGVQADHPDLQGRVNLSLSRNFTGDRYGVGAAYGGSVPQHGTICAGVVAANGTQLLGSAPDVELVDCRVFAAGGGGAATSDYLAAIVHAADVGCDVTNLSLGPGISTPLQYVLLDRLGTSNVIEYTREREMLIVVAAGNSAIDLGRYPAFSFPDAPNAMLVSATGPLGFGWPLVDRNGDGRLELRETEDPIRLDAPYHELAAYSNYGAGIIDIGAPGGNYDSVALANDSPPGWFLDMLPTTSVSVGLDRSTGEFSFENGTSPNVGTSFAAPQVAAAAALLRSVDPDVPAAEIQRVLRGTATRVRTEPDPYLGSGFLNPLAAIRAV